MVMNNILEGSCVSQGGGGAYSINQTEHLKKGVPEGYLVLLLFRRVNAFDDNSMTHWSSRGL